MQMLSCNLWDDLGYKHYKKLFDLFFLAWKEFFKKYSQNIKKNLFVSFFFSNNTLFNDRGVFPLPFF